MFSVVIPLYNKENYIIRAIKSVINQTLQPIEIIIVNDESTDLGVKKIQDLKNPLVKIIHQKNQGPGAARNTGVKSSTGEWIAFLDADDIWLPNHLLELSNIITRCPEASLVSTCYTSSENRYSRINTHKGSIYFLNDIFKISAIYKKIPLSSSSSAVRRMAFPARGFLNLYSGEDIEFWFKFSLENKISISDKITVFYDKSINGLSKSNEKSKRLPPIKSREDILSITPVLRMLKEYETYNGALNYSQKLFIGSRLLPSLKRRIINLDFLSCYYLLTSKYIFYIGNLIFLRFMAKLRF